MPTILSHDILDTVEVMMVESSLSKLSRRFVLMVLLIGLLFMNKTFTKNYGKLFEMR